MIDIEKARKEFLKYTEENKIDNERVQTKVSHTFRVASNCKAIAKNLKLTKEQIELAELIGILHDIGRFEQYKIYDKNTDSIEALKKTKKFDHGKAGVEVLKNNQYIRKYIENNEYDNIIYTAVYEHNKYELSKNLTQEEELFSKIIKDADKLDIIYETIYIYWQEPYRIKELEEGELSPKMLEDFYNGQLANNENRISEADQILRFCSFIYDINFKYSFEMLKESGNINKMVDRFNYKVEKTKEELQKVKEIANKYIIEKAK